MECVTVAEHFNFNLGNALKYIWRAGVKSKDPVEDLKKAAWYVAREIRRLTGEEGEVDKLNKLKARLAEEESRRAKYQAVDAAARRFVSSTKEVSRTGSTTTSDVILNGPPLAWEALQIAIAESA